MVTYTKKPQGKFPLAPGMGDSVYKLDLLAIENLSALLSTFCMTAVDNPGVLQKRYFEEACNGYEYEERALWDAKTKTLTTNFGNCPLDYNHHLWDDPCHVCGASNLPPSQKRYDE
jgi:hypothetical protein